MYSSVKIFLCVALVAFLSSVCFACEGSSCTVIQGGVKTESGGPQGSKTILGSSIQHQIPLGDNVALAATIGKEHVSGNGQSLSTLTKGIEGSFKSDLGVSGIKLNDKSFSNGDSLRETSISHGFNPTDNLKLTGTAGLSSGNFGGVKVNGQNFGLEGQGLSGLGKTSFGVKDSVLNIGGESRPHSLSGILRHDVPILPSTNFGASVKGLKEGPLTGSGFGLHLNKESPSFGTTSFDFNRDRLHGIKSTDTFSLTQNIPVGKDAFVAPFASHSRNTPSFGTPFNSNAFGFNFGYKF